MYHLTFTDNQRNWKKDFTNIFFGKLNLPGKLEKSHSEYKYIIPSWHWNDLSKLQKDIEYIDSCYEKLIEKISENLNNIHNVKWSLESWKILIGPWLRRYLMVLYDRIENIKDISNSYDLKSFTILTKESYEDLFSETYDDFQDNLNNENFNITLCSLIAEKLLDNKKFEKTKIKIETKTKSQKIGLKKNIYFKEIIKKIIKSKNYKKLFSFFLKKNKFYFHELSTNSIFKKIVLFYRLKSFPHLGFDHIEVKSEKKYSKDLRKRFTNEVKKKLILNNFFENCMIDFIYYFIPKCYLESFHENKDLSIKEFRYIDPEIIVDQTGYHKDEIFKFWLAQVDKSEKKLVLVQHGGEYEVLDPNHDFIKQELEISNKYLSWGWKKNNYNVIPISCPISFINKKNRSESSINVILRPFKKYFSGSSFLTYGLIQENYIKLVLNFLNSLDKEKNVRLCFHQAKFSLEDEEEFRSYFLENLNNKKKFSVVEGLKNYINETSLNIFTYFGTPFDQAISSNIPSMVLTTDKNLFNKNYKKVFDSLENSKILHTNQGTLINHLKQTSNRTLNWWNDESTQKSRDNYCQNFARTSSKSQSIIEVLEKL